MADAHSKRECITCGTVFEQNKVGRPAAKCQACRCHKKANTSCLRCGADLPKGRSKYCSARCKDGTKMTREEYRESVKAKPDSVCHFCGKEYKAHLGGAHRRNGYDSKYCSRDCYKGARVKLKEEREAQREDKPSIPRIATCVVCGVKFNASNKTCITCSDVCRHERAKQQYKDHYLKTYYSGNRQCKCKCCGVEFTTDYGDKRRVFCSDECSKKQNSKERRKKYGTTHRKRARAFGVRYTPVNALAVFDRDGWRCQICGKPTPSSLRGTFNDSAPELDHRIPMSLGGEHSYENTQCSCRKCNIEKGNTRSVGQMPLFGA